MNTHEFRSRERGFTLVEMLVVVAILFVSLMIGIPYLSTQIQRSKLVGVANQAAGLMRIARMEAIKSSRSAFVTIDPARRVIGAFSDLNGSGVLDAGDRLLSEVALPSHVTFTAPGGATGAASVKGLTARGGGEPSVAVFRTDGSVENTGALRFGALELRGAAANYFEVDVSPAATARIKLRKWRGPASPSAADLDDDNNWHENGQGGSWTWS